MPAPPPTRNALLNLIVATIDSAFVGLDDVEALAAKMEARGIRFAPVTVVPDATNPYAPGKP